MLLSLTAVIFFYRATLLRIHLITAFLSACRSDRCCSSVELAKHLFKVF